MRLKTRFRISAGASLGAVLALASLMGWAFLESRHANENVRLAGVLERESFERVLLREEYLLLGEPRARLQWRAKTDRLRKLLSLAEVEFDGEADRRSIREMEALRDRSDAHLEHLDGGDGAQADRAGAGRAEELRRRVISRLLLISNDQNGRARQLAASASARFDAMQRRVTWALIAMLGGVLAVTLLNARMTARVVERRIARLLDGAGQVAAGNLDHRLAIEGDDELGELAIAFDEMTARLQASHASLETSNRELEAFSSSVSHDLRAPLRSISGFSQAVLDDYGQRLDATGRKYLEMANDGAREMGQLIDDLLGLSRVSRIEMARGPVDLSALALAVVADLRREGPERRVEVEVAPDLVVVGDPTLLRLAVENLLRNAWKFTSRHPSARIVVGRAPSPGGDAFFVADDGAGFDMAYVEKLFNPFQRLHRSSEFPGTGIGLATVKRIVLRHGGTISARGEVERGATFTFTLPHQGAPHV